MAQLQTATSPSWGECDYPTAAQIGVAGDEDYYMFSTTSSGSYAFETLGTTNVQGYLYDSNHNLIAFDYDNGDGDNMKIEYDLLGYQTYYVKVCHESASGTGSYGLKIIYPDNASSINDWEGNDFSSATQLTTNNIVSYTGLGINNASDIDFFTFTPSADGIYTFQTLGNFDTSGEVYNNNQTLLKSDDNSGVDNNFSIYVPLTANQTYYLKVTATNSGTTGTYGVDIAMGRCLEVPIYMQQPYDNLCWATSASMAISYFNNDNINHTVEIAEGYIQKHFIALQLETFFGSDFYKYPYCFNRQALLRDVHTYMEQHIEANVTINTQEYAQGLGYPTQNDKYDYTLDTLKQSIDNGYPMLVKVRNPNGSRHMMIIKGYKECSDGINVIYNDPLFGERMIKLNDVDTWAYTTFNP